MGGGSWDSDSYRAYSSATAGMDSTKRFTASTTADSVLRGATAHLNPSGVVSKFNPTGTRTRESRDSVDNPNSTPVIIALDLTGSMRNVINELAGNGLGTLFTEILARKPVTDPHLMFMGVGDADAHDRVPLQVSQFEADNRIVTQLTDLYIEGGGGGNSYESYNLPWYYAAVHTQTDAFTKRGKKGYLFTVGDEEIPQQPLSRHVIQSVIGDAVERDYSNAELLEMVGHAYEVFHVIVGEGYHAKQHERAVREGWSMLLGQRALWLADHKKLSEVVVSAIEVNEGRDPDAVVSSWTGDTSVVVADAIRGLTKRDPGGASAGAVRF